MEGSRVIIIEAGVHRGANEDDFCDWLRKWGIKPERTYRVVIDGDELTALCYAEDQDGHKFVCKDPKQLEYREAAKAEPITVTFDDEVPASVADPVRLYG